MVSSEFTAKIDRSEGVYTFIINDPGVEVNRGIDRIHIKYEFHTAFTYGFRFKINTDNTIEQKELIANDHNISGQLSEVDTTFSRSIIDMYISDKQMIFNGCFYKLY